jgi:hypothetical protein
MMDPRAAIGASPDFERRGYTKCKQASSA